MVAQQLQGNDVQQSLQAVNRLRHSDRLRVGGDVLVILVAENDGLGLARGDLRESVLDLGVERVLGHDDEHGHVLVNQGKRAVLEFTGKDSWRAGETGTEQKRLEKTNPLNACS